MENMKELKLEELASVDGGVSLGGNGGSLNIWLKPGESAAAELQKKLSSGIRVFGMAPAVEDPQNRLMEAARILDEKGMIGNARCCTVEYTLSGFAKVIVKAVTFPL